MNNHPQKPLLLAYIIFLFIAMGYHLIAEIFDLEYNTWNTIIVAATVSSYAFSMSSLHKFVAKKSKTYIHFSTQYLESIKQLQQLGEKNLTEGDSKDKLLKSNEDSIHRISSHITDLEKMCKNREKQSFIYGNL